MLEAGLLARLATWVNFYVIVGSSAGALTGLQFVVMTLITESESSGSMLDVQAFGTPTVIHFCMALLLSALMAVPWHEVSALSLCIGACGVLGIAYSLRVLGHARKAHYKPDAEDWFWYTVLPLIGHVALVFAAILLWWRAPAALFVVAAIALMFLFLGLHNAWDTVTYVATQRRHKPAGEGDQVK